MKKFDDEINNYGLSNPDGEMKNIYENKVDFKNDKRSFVNENNVVGLNEQVKVKERINYSDKKQGALNGQKTNLALVSSFFAVFFVDDLLFLSYPSMYLSIRSCSSFV